MRKVLGILSVCLMLMMVGCKSSKNAMSSTSTEIGDLGKEGANMLSQRFDSAISSYKDWHDVVMPVDLSLHQPKEFSVSGRATMVKDECVYISIRVLGFEAANIYITPDSIFASYKLNKIYVAEETSQLLANYPVTIGNIQDLLLGRAFMLGKGTLSSDMKKKLTLNSTTELWSVIPNQNLKNVIYSFFFDLSSNALAMTKVDIEGKKPVECKYQNPPVNTVAGYVSKGINLSTTLKNMPIDADLRWNLSGAKWNTGATAKWKTPKGYKRISASDLLKAM